MSKITEADKDRIAYFYCQGLRYNDIVRKAGIEVSEPSISRIINEYKKRGWILVEPILRLPDERKRGLHVLERGIENDLLEKYGPLGLRSAIVVPSEEADEWIDVRQRVAREAARFLEDLLVSGSHVVGTLWGRTLRTLAEHIAPSKQNRDLTFLALRGGLGLEESHPDFRVAEQCQANRIADLLAERFGGHSLHLDVPAVIPKDFGQDQAKLDVIWEFIKKDVSYRKIFGSDTSLSIGLLGEVSTVLTGIGSADEFGSYWLKWTNQYLDDKHNLKEKGVIGDLACLLLGYDKSEFSRRANSRVVGIKLNHFRQIAQNYAKAQKPEGAGVLLVTYGPQRAEAIHYCLMHRMINTLALDRLTAEAVLEIDYAI